MKPDQGSVILANKDGLMKVMAYMHGEILEKQGNT